MTRSRDIQECGDVKMGWDWQERTLVAVSIYVQIGTAVSEDFVGFQTEIQEKYFLIDISGRD